MTELPPLTKQQVCDALWNKSQSKQLYTIPKAIRFHPLKKSNNTDFYELPTFHNERSAGIGYGNRSELGFDIKNTNKPAFYSIKRDFDEGNELGPHYSFPHNREAYKKVYIPFKKEAEPNNPGPGHYEIKNSFGDAPLYSMGIKSIGQSFDNCSPGPAYYKNNISINGDGYYPLSTTENTKPINFSLYKGKRFNYRCIIYFF